MQTDDSTLVRYTHQNPRAWDEIAGVRARTFPPADFFARGGVTLGPRVVEEVRAAFGDFNLRLIHLQCSTGEETLSWAVLGAQVTGVDISPEQVIIAREKAAAAGLPANFYAADVYNLPAALPPENLGDGFDAVFTGGGAIVWLPDIARWAQVVAALLRPGGRLFLNDEHPLAGCLWVENGQLQITGDYFSRGRAEKNIGWTHFKGGEDAREEKYEFNWPLGDIVTALAQAGLIIERLEEYPGGPEWRFGPLQNEVRRLPGEYLLVARKS